MADRTEFLARVRAAAAAAELPEQVATAPVVAPPNLPEVDLQEHFGARVRAVDGHLHQVTAADTVALVVDLLERHDARRVLAWDDDHLPVSGLRAALAMADVDVVDHVTPSQDHFVHNAGYHDVDAGVTGALAGLAESGSIVLGSGPGEPRMASLVPLTHIALLRRSTLHRSLTHFVVDRPEMSAASANTTIVTGPSRTADIEQSLNLGVHGPRHLHVVLIEDL